VSSCRSQESFKGLTAGEDCCPKTKVHTSILRSLYTKTQPCEKDKSCCSFWTLVLIGICQVSVSRESQRSLD